MISLGDFLYPTETLNVLSDFGSDEPFLIDGDSLIFYLYSIQISSKENEKNSKQLLSTDKCQSISFFHYFETFIANLLNRKTKFHILFIQENEIFYKNYSLRLIRNLCIDYYINNNNNNNKINDTNVQFTLIKSKWWNDFSNITTFLLENMFSFIFVLFPVDNIFADNYVIQVQELFLVNSLIDFDYIVELNSITFEGSCVETIIYGKGKEFEKKAIPYFKSDLVLNEINQLFNQEFEKFENDKLNFKNNNNYNNINMIINNSLKKEDNDNSCNTQISIFKSTFNQKLNQQFLNRVYCIYLVLLKSVVVKDRGFILPKKYEIDERVLEYLNQVSYENLIYLHLKQEEKQEQQADQQNNYLNDIEHLDYIDFKLFYQILIQIQFKLPNNQDELNEIFGNEVIQECELIWNQVESSSSSSSSFSNFNFNNYKDKINDLKLLIEKMKLKSIEINKYSNENKIYSIENDFINSVALEANEKLKQFKNQQKEEEEEKEESNLKDINQTRFIDNFHYHSGRTIEPDAFSVSLKEFKFKDKKSKQRASDLSTNVFKKYADSLNDPRNILIINKLDPTKEELEKERLKKEKEDLKKNFKKPQQSNSTNNNNNYKPKSERDKILELKLQQDKKRYELELLECKSTLKLIKFLDSLELLPQLPELYIQYFHHLIDLFKNEKSNLIRDQTNRKLKELQQLQHEKKIIKSTELSDTQIKQIEDSFNLNSKEKTIYYQLIQKYLRYFIKDNQVAGSGSGGINGIDKKFIFEISKCLYEISKSFIGLKDLSNFINKHFQLKFKELDESNIHVGNDDKSLNNSIEFQLKHSPETLVRNTGATQDSRVRHFKPDAWQVELLDIVDKRESALICASTSSGKTFISFYTFEKILRESNDGIVVFVSPTKALVNQMYAEVLGRYEKNYQTINHHPSKNKLVGVFTRDMRIDIETCQILITVPQCLEILFLSVINVPFISRVKYVIFDEVHQIASSVEGAVWERLLLINPSPFLALSATIGNLYQFYDFLKRIDPQRKVSLINHQRRFNDLKSHFLHVKNAKTDQDTGKILEPKIITIEPLHPMASLDQKKTGLSNISPDLKLVAYEAIEMYQVFKDKFGYDHVKHLDPNVFFKDVSFKHFNLEKEHVEKYQNELKNFYQSLPAESTKRSIVKSLTSPLYDQDLKFDAFSHITNICLHLQKENLLPAIIFSFNRAHCSKLALRVNDEIVYKNTNPRIFEEKKRLDFEIERMEKSLGKALADLEPNDPEKMELERLRSKRASLDYLKPQFSNILSTDIGEKIAKDPLTPALMQGIGVHHSGCDKNYLRNVEYLFRSRKIQIVFSTSSLAMGVNMPAKTVLFLGDSPYLNVLTYRQCAGRAGRRGFDAQGSVIFAGIPKQKINRLINSGLSKIVGNTVVSPSLCLTLMSRYDYSLNGPNKLSTTTAAATATAATTASLSTTTSNKTVAVEKEKEKEILDNWDDDDDQDNKKESLVLDNWDDDEEEKKEEIKPSAPPPQQQQQTKQISKLSKESLIDIQILEKSTKSLINNSFFLSNPLQIQFQFLFSIDYLYREGYITKNGIPLDFSGIVTHLNYLEPFNFIFVSLLKSGVFDNLPSNQKDCDIFIIHILSFLFCVKEIPSVYKRSPSILVLPPLPDKIRQVIDKHNERLLKTFSTYLYIYGTYLKDNDFLPLSSKNNSLSVASKVNSESKSSAKTWNSNLESLKPSNENYKFNCLLSGIFKITNLKKLKQVLGSNTYFSTRTLPWCELNGLVNSYLLDFHKHSQKRPLIEDNMIKESDLWTLLKDFSLILKVIATALSRRNPESPISLAFLGVSQRFLKKFGDNFNY